LFKILESAHRLLPSYQAELAPFAERVLADLFADLVDGLSSGGSDKTRERALAGLRALGRILVELSRLLIALYGMVFDEAHIYF
jgi:hypothetical protein